VEKELVSRRLWHAILAEGEEVKSCLERERRGEA
jgi:hypothetical protein